MRHVIDSVRRAAHGAAVRRLDVLRAARPEWRRRRWRYAGAAACLVVLLLAALRNDPPRTATDSIPVTPVVMAADRPGAGGSFPSGPPVTRPTTGQATTRPTTQPAGLDLYDPDAEGADPAWAMPAELTTAEVRELVIKIDRLNRDATRLGPRLTEHRRAIEALIAEDVVDSLWQGVLGRGFKDAALPHDWYEATKDEVGILASLDRDTREVEEGMMFGVLAHRLGMAKVRAIGGRCLNADLLFIAGLQYWVDGEHADLDRAEPKVADVTRRVKAEFGGALRDAAPVQSFPDPFTD